MFRLADDNLECDFSGMDENEEIGTVVENAKREFRQMSPLNKAAQIASIPTFIAALMNISAGLTYVDGYFSEYIKAYRLYVNEPIRYWVSNLFDVQITIFQFDVALVYTIIFWSISRAISLSGYEKAFNMDRNAFAWKAFIFLIPLLFFAYFPVIVTYFLIGYIVLEIVGIGLSLFLAERRILEYKTEPNISEEERKYALKLLVYGTRALHYAFIYLVIVIVITMLLFGVHRWWIIV